MIAQAERSPSGVAVAIPVKNEADRIGDCLRALADQREAPPIAVVLLLNDCTDGTAAIVRRLACNLPFDVHCIETSLPRAQSGAGYARRLAMIRAAELASDSVLLTTDADTRAPPDWIACNLRAIALGADAVAGRAVIDPVEALLIPQALHEDDAFESAYAALLDEIRAVIDPDPADPWPRHSEHSGASIAVRTRVYQRAGGIPAMAPGEDRAFLTALERIDARIRHAPEVRVTVSGRIFGRAEGGMADTIRRRMMQPDKFLDHRLEPAANAARRAIAKTVFRKLWLSRCSNPTKLHRLRVRLAVSLEQLQEAITQPHFGAAWMAIEAANLRLRRQLVPASETGAQTRKARRILALLHAAGFSHPPSAADQAAIAIPEAAMPG